MKYYILLTVILLFPFLLFAQIQEIKSSSEIKEVCVYTKGALVKRTANVNIPAGKSLIVFTDISANIDVNSIQIAANGNFTILSVQHSYNFIVEDVQNETVVELQNKITAINKEVEIQNNYLSVYRAEQEMLLTNKIIGSDVNGLSITDLQTAMQYLRTRLTEIKRRMYECEVKIKNLQEENVKYQNQIKEIGNTPQKKVSEISVTVSAANAVSATFFIEYLAPDAAWVPEYDFRAEKISTPLNVIFKANITQSTGEDWKDVKLNISTGNPTKSSIVKYVSPWLVALNYPNQRNSISNNNSNIYNNGARYVAYGQLDATHNKISGEVYDTENNPIPGASIICNDFAGVGAVTDIDGRFQLTVPVGAKTIVVSFVGMNSLEIPMIGSNYYVYLSIEDVGLGEVVVTGLGISRSERELGYSATNITEEEISGTIPLEVNQVETSSNIIYEISMPYTIPSDNDGYQVEIGSYDLNATFEYFCSPKLSTDVYLIARVSGWDEHSFLSGNSNLFFEDTYLGRSFFDAATITDTLNLSFGTDENIVVKRERNQNFTEEKIVGSSKLTTIGWTISVRNKRSQNIKILIEDQIPISTNNEIEVLNVESAEATINEGTGIVNWRFTLPAMSSKTLNLKFTLKYPKRHSILVH